MAATSWLACGCLQLPRLVRPLRQLLLPAIAVAALAALLNGCASVALRGVPPSLGEVESCAQIVREMERTNHFCERSNLRSWVVGLRTRHRDWHQHQPGGYGTAIDVTIGASPLRLGVDTGASLGSLYRASPEYPVAEVELSNRQTRSHGIFEYLMSTPARLRSLRVGRTLHHPFALGVSEEAFLWNHHPIGQNGNLGMAFLLRYPAVCFAWDEQRLYLGTLGSCAGGVEPTRPHLRGSLLLGLGVEARDGTRFTATVDTGARYTNCSAAFRNANSGDRAFSLGANLALGGECFFDEAVLYPIVAA